MLVMQFDKPDHLVDYAYYEVLYWRLDKLTGKEHLIVENRPTNKPKKTKASSKWFSGAALIKDWNLKSFGEFEIELEARSK